MTAKVISYDEARLEFFKEQLADAKQSLAWQVHNSPVPNVCSEKGAMSPYFRKTSMEARDFSRVRLHEEISFQDGKSAV